LRRKFRTLMFIVAICVVLTGMQVLLGITNGLDTQIESQFRRDQIDIVALEANTVMVFNSTVPEETWRAVSGEPGLRRVYGASLALVSTPKFPMLIIFGIEPDRFVHYRILEGRHPQAEGEVSVGKNLRKEFGATLGSAIEIFRKELTVVGFHESGIETEDSAVLMTLHGAQALTGKEGSVSTLALQLEPGVEAGEVIARLEKQYPQLTFTLAQDYTKTQQNIQFIKGVGIGLGVLSVVGGSIIVLIFSLIIVQERIREIAILRAVGWRRSRVMRVILGETMLLAFLGALLSLGVSSLILYIMSQTPQITSMLPVQFTWNSVFITFAVTVVLGFGGGFASAWRASALNPLEAIGRE
jgi:ABC-type lipoprotein release transport system permease subunit